MPYCLNMRHEIPWNEADLHEEGDSTLCPCGCDIKTDAGGEMVCKHTPYNCGDLLLAADNLIQQRVYPESANKPFRRTKNKS